VVNLLCSFFFSNAANAFSRGRLQHTKRLLNALGFRNVSRLYSFPAVGAAALDAMVALQCINSNSNSNSKSKNNIAW
jgi:hypothetical protein